MNNNKLRSKANMPAKLLSILIAAVFSGGIAGVNAQVAPESWVTVPPTPSPTLENLSIPADADSKGMWSAVNNWPMNGLHAILLSDGRVLSFGTSLDGGSQNGRWYDVWDPTIGVGASAHNTVYDATRQDSFCSAAAYLTDGNLLISGGNGSTTSTLYETASHSSYTDSASMAEARWYPTMISLADGRPIMMGGMVPYTEGMVDDPEQAIANGWPSMTPEVYESGSWRSLFGAYSREAFGPDYLRTSYPRAWVAPNGLVFGISADKMWYLDPDASGGNGAITYVANFKQGYSSSNPVNVGAVGTAAMFDIGRILQVGGNGGHNGDGLPASNMATVIDINGATPVLSEQTRMSYARRYPNAAVLANGEVVITGGTTFGNHYSGEPGDAVYAAEIWNPTNGSWTLGASASRIRVYHSITTVLTDGTVLSTGGGTPGPVTNLNAEIYYPPYLFENVAGVTQLATRPVITAISGLAYDHGADLQLDMSNEDSISQLVLLGNSSGTHSFNAGQRRIPLSFTQERFRLSTTLPDANLTPPGYYQVVAISAAGVPSKGVIIGIGQGQAAPPVIVSPYDPPSLEDPISTPVIQAGEIATYTVSPTSGTTYSWSFSDTGETTAFSSDPEVSHLFTDAGVYVVTLTAQASDGATSTKTVVQAVSTETVAGTAASSSQLAIEPATAGGRIWVVNPDNDTVSVLDPASNSLISEIAVGSSPRSVAIASDGRVWVTNKHDASISIIDANTLSVVDTIDLPRASQPHGLVFSSNGTDAFVVLEASGSVVKLNASSGAQTVAVAVGINARHLAISADSSKLLVSRFITPALPGESTAAVDVHGGGAEVLVIDPTSMTLINTTLLQHSDKPDTEIQGSGIPNYLGAAAISPDGSTAWVPSKQDNISRGTLRSALPLDFQNTVRAISSRIDLGTLSEDYALRVDYDNSSLASAASYHPNGVYLFVALETSREVAVINALNGSELFRIAVGIAPQALAISADGLTLYVKEFLERRVAVVDLSALITSGQLNSTTVASILTVQNEKLAANVLAGKALFYDARDPRLARDNYMSCASCHNDGGHDGRVWDITGFGEGLRNTIALNGRAAMGHGFLHWSANFDELQDFEKQIRDLAGGTGLMSNSDYNSGTVNQALGDKKAGLSTDLDNLAAYVSSLTTFAPSPLRNEDGSLSAAAVAGKAVFNYSCQSCHGGRDFTISGDASTLRNIGTITADSGQRLGASLSGIDIPTLRDAWATAPYLHNGSAATLADAIAAHINVAISPTDLANVVAYVEQIGNDEAGAGLLADGAWSFSEGAGTTVADDSGNGHPMTLSNTSWTTSPRGSAAAFNGGNSSGTIGTALVDTSASFTVAAWVKLDNLNGWQTFVNQDGANVSGFWLQYSQHINSNKFLLSMHNVDSTSSTAFRAVSTTTPVVGTWYHIAGVRDRTAGTMKIYVNGVLEGTTSYTGGWAANGALNIGRGKWGAPNDWVAGGIDEVNVFNYALNDSEILKLYEPTPNEAPGVTLNAPLDGSSFETGTSIELSADALDSDGSITEVRFYSGSTLLATDNSAPYSYSWNNAALGNHSLSAVAVDNDGAESTSAVITISVLEIPNQIPSISLSAPLDGASFDEGAVITLSADAVDNDGSISEVRFYADGSLLASDSSAPYSYNWTNAAAGSYSLLAVAIDDDAAAGSSATISVTVIANIAPSVSLSTPLADSSFDEGTAITLSADAADSDGNIVEVRFYDGSTLLATDTSAPYSYNWTDAAIGDHSLTAVAVDDDGAQSSSAVINISMLELPNVLPTVSLDAPLADASFDEGEVIGLAATATDSDGSITEVRFYAGSTLLYTDSSAPYSFNWNNAAAGTHSLSAVALDDEGATSTSASINVTVIANVAPSVSLSEPLAGASFDEGTSIDLAANAADSDGNVVEVRFYDGSTLLASDTTAPFSYTWPSAAIGSHSLTAVAIDDDGAQTISSAISISVIELPNVLPTVSLATPLDGANFDEGTDITITATAADSDGSITAVRFYAGSTLLATDTSAPYSYTWTNALTGDHSLTAVAVDNDGDETTSAAITISVIANVAPTVSLSAPLADANFDEGVAIILSADAIDSDGSISEVRFYDGTTLLAIDTSAPYNYTWLSAAVGDHSLSAVAMDNDGAQTVSSTINISVVELPNQAPTVSLDAPLADASFDEGETISLSATAADSDGSIAEVRFYDGGTLLATDSSAPYSFNWNNAAPGNHSLSAVAVDDEGATTSSSTINITVVANVAPSVSLTAPLADASFDEGTTIAITASAADSDGSIVEVRFYAGSTLLATDSSAPYSYNWSNAAIGNHSLTAVAIDDDGAQTVSSAINISVVEIPNQAPTVSLTAPLANALFNEGSLITISATAADSDGSISAVRFYAGSTLLATDSSAPYSYTWSGAAIGNYSLTAVALDNEGAQTSSAAISISVVEVPNVAPTVSLTAPDADSTFEEGTAITLSADALDSDGSISEVRFYAGSTLLATDSSAPYSYTWNSAAIGNHSLTAVAIDNDAAQTTSAPISINIITVPNVAPTVSLTAPAANATFTEGDSITLSANAADSDGSISEVRFYDGASLLYTDTSAPYSYTWSGAALGSHSLTAVAVDNEGAETTSSAIAVTVEEIPPVVLENLAPSASLNASYQSWFYSLNAVNDGYTPSSSTDTSNGAYSNYRWFNRGSGATNWVSFSWSSAKTLSAFEVYWFTDNSRILAPTTATVEYWNGSSWVSLGNIGLSLNTFNRLEFSEVSTTQIRVSMRSSRYTGIIEARVFGYE